MRVRRVDAERFVAGAGNGEVVSCGRSECRCDIGIGEFLRKSRTKRSFWSHDV